MDTGVGIAVIGATTGVGEAILAKLAERRFPAARVRAVARESAAGGRVEFGDGYLRVEAVEAFDFSSVALALFCAAPSLTAEHAPRAATAGCVVVDSSGCYAGDEAVPLVVPQVNPEALVGHKGIVAVPHSAVTALVAALKPLALAGLARVDVVSLQAVSASGRGGVDELAAQSAQLLNGLEARRRVFPRQIAFNLLPQIGELDSAGYSSAESEIISQSRRVLGLPALELAVTAVQVPVFYGHSAVVHLALERALSVPEARALLADAAGVEVVDDEEDGLYPTPVTDASGQDAVFVGRIRADVSRAGLNFWVVADNVHEGAALNSVQIAERFIADHL